MNDLEQAIRRALPAGMVLGSADPDLSPPLWPGETVPESVPKRMVEFAAGRAAARDGLRRLARPLAAIPMGPDRAPHWPMGVVGSISHCDGACMAVLAESRDLAGVGLDLEPLVPIASDLWDSILTPEELAGLRGFPADMRGIHVLRVFVAKEAAFKAQHAVSGRLIGFDGLKIRISDQDFAATLCCDVGSFPIGTSVQGRLVNHSRFAAALAWIPNV